MPDDAGSDDVLAKRMSFVMVHMGLLAAAVLLLGVSAPYGRYKRGGWGFLIPARAAWLAQELPSLLLPACLLATKAGATGCSSDPGSMVLLFLFLAHYFNRALIFPFLIRGGKPTPASVCLMAMSFCAYNGFLQGYQLCVLCPTVKIDGFFVTGVAIWGAGAAINVHSDSVLRNLRSRAGESGYKIPRGGLFELVSGANFFGEILEWFGFAIAARSLPAASFALFTLCNIGPRALQHHRFYVDRFPDYPRSRKALIPFVL